MNRTCSVEGCEFETDTLRKGFCQTHYSRFRRHGDPRAQVRTTVRGEPVRYGTAHLRLNKARGWARDHSCEHCGKQASDWAYSGEDPDERTDAVTGAVFSLNYFEHYLPLCRSCHRKMDWDRFYAQNSYQFTPEDRAKRVWRKKRHPPTSSAAIA